MKISSQTGTFFYFKKSGHNSRDCCKGPWNGSTNQITRNSSSNAKPKNVEYKKPYNQSEVELKNAYTAAGHKTADLQVLLEKKNKPTATIRPKKEIRLNEGNENYSIKNDLVNSKANISFSQLIQSSPEIRSELTLLLKKPQIDKEARILEHNSTTNCKSAIRIHGKKHIVVIDTGAALPISIANHDFNANLIVMRTNKEALILGIDRLRRHQAVIDIYNKELILPKLKYDVILSISTSIEIERFNRLYEDTNEDANEDTNEDTNEDKYEVFGIGKQVEDKTESHKNDEANSDILVNDYTQLTGTNIVEHSIDTGDSKPLKIRPYRIPQALKQEAQKETKQIW
ncbi:hypothetical protein BB560_006542 [Smittium megazygosporum]|uniref:Aspartic peptidase DDI1-type domain-containing protein n=1 Tax=Smittium megazygosporum TaxID=133381 RepID=A0A2T9Y4F5_9FUNG|nr:hypothetical protein BB560_006542 [Smittium megazygosporum]